MYPEGLTVTRGETKTQRTKRGSVWGNMSVGSLAQQLRLDYSKIQTGVAGVGGADGPWCLAPALAGSNTLTHSDWPQLCHCHCVLSNLQLCHSPANWPEQVEKICNPIDTFLTSYLFTSDKKCPVIQRMTQQKNLTIYLWENLLKSF